MNRTKERPSRRFHQGHLTSGRQRRGTRAARKARAWASVKLKPETSFVSSAAGRCGAAMSPPTGPSRPPIQGRITTEKRMRNPYSSLKRNDYAFHLVQNPHRRFSGRQLSSSGRQLVENPIRRRMSQHKRNKRIGLKRRVRRQFANDPISRIEAARPGTNFAVLAIYQSVRCRHLKINARNIVKISRH